jgi:MFS family permease
MRTAAVSLAVGLVLADSSIAVLALPAIYRDLGVDLGDLHWVLTTFNLVLAVAAIPAARMIRPLGPGRAFAIGLALFALASAGCAAAPGFGVLLASRGIQALGGALAVVAALELLSSVVRPRTRAVAFWVGAGAAGAAVGPALGGVLTDLISWRAVFALQVPLALLPIGAVLGLRTSLLQQPRALRPRIVPNIALALVSAALAAPLFLVVLLLVEGWGFSPIAAAAVVTVLPLAAIAAAPLVRGNRSPGARAAGGAILVAGGLGGLALLPRAGWIWTVPPQILVGAGLALAITALTQTALAGREPPALHGGVTIAARHAGVVLGLLLLSPLLVADLDDQRGAAERAGTARLLDSPVSATTKIRVARGIGHRLDATPGRIPELRPVFRSVEADPEERPALANLEHQLDDVVERAVTSSFTRSFAVAAALALAALIPIALTARSQP